MKYTPQIIDTYTEATDTTLADHTPDTGIGWGVATGSGTMEVNAANDYLVPETGGSSIGVVYAGGPSPSSADQYMQCTLVNSSSDDTVTFFLRFHIETTTNFNFYALRFSNGVLQLVKVVAGTGTSITTGTPPSNGDTVRFEVYGDILRVFVNDNLRIKAKDTSLTNAGQFYAKAFGQYLVAGDDMVDQIIDDFEAGVLEADADFFDEFDNASTTELSSHTPDIGTGWTEVLEIGGTVGINVSANNLYAAVSGGISDGTLYSADKSGGWGDDQAAEVQMRNNDSSDDTNILAVRIQDSDNFYALRYNTSVFRIYKSVGGSITPLGTELGSGQVANGDLVRLEAEGTTIRALVNGTELISLTDSDISSGSPGLGAGGIVVTGDDLSSQSYWDFYAYELSTATTQTITAKARIQQARTQTIEAKAVIGTKWTRTIEAKGKIQLSFTKTLEVKARIEQNRIKTVTSKARIEIFTQQSIAVKGRIELQKTRQISAKSAIKLQFSQEIEAKSTILRTFSAQTEAKASLLAFSTQTITAKARILGSVYQHIDAKASISREFSQDIDAKARISIQSETSVSAKADIRTSITQNISAKARIGGGGYQTLISKANIRAEQEKTISSKGSISAPQPVTIEAKASLQVTTTQTISAKARMGGGGYQTLQAKANIIGQVQQTVTAKAKIGEFDKTTITISAKANIFSSTVYEIPKPVFGGIEMPYPDEAIITPLWTSSENTGLKGGTSLNTEARKYQYIMRWDYLKVEYYDAIEGVVNNLDPAIFTYMKWPQSRLGVLCLGSLSERRLQYGTGKQFFLSSVTLTLIEVENRI